MDGHALQIDELKGTKPTEKIDLSGKGLGVVSAIIIASCIKENGVLKELKYAAPHRVFVLVSARVDTDAYSLTVPILPLTCSLGFNDIGDEGASALASILKETQITTLECAATQ